MEERLCCAGVVHKAMYRFDSLFHCGRPIPGVDPPNPSNRFDSIQKKGRITRESGANDLPAIAPRVKGFAKNR